MGLDMRTSVSFSLLFVLVLAACDDDSKKPVQTPTKATTAPTASPSVAPAVSAAPTAAATDATLPLPLPLSGRLKCKTLLPETAMVGVLASMKAGQPAATCTECGPTCSLLDAGKPFEGATVSYVCNEKLSKEALTTKLATIAKGMKKPKPLTEFGKGGIGGERESGLYYQVTVQDDDSDCVVTVDWMRGKREPTMAAAQAAIAGIKQADLASGTK
jgi:hypothetical protein